MMAERKGFEPLKEFPPYPLSKRAHSTTLPSLHLFQKSIEELLVSPMPIYLIIIGFVVGGVARGIIVGLLVMITALFFTNLEVQNISLTLLIVILTAILFSLAGMINAIFANSFDDISIVPTFVLTPLIYLGGVFYSIELLSDFWQGVSKINPILYMVNSFRYGTPNISHRVNIGTSAETASTRLHFPRGAI